MTKPRAIAYRHSVGCPHCKGDARVRSSRSLTPTCKQLYLQCSDIECGHTFVAAIEILRTIVPSAAPDPQVHLPIAAPRRKLVAANDDGRLGARAPEVAPLRAANDDYGVGEAVNTGT